LSSLDVCIQFVEVTIVNNEVTKVFEVVNPGKNERFEILLFVKEGDTFGFTFNWVWIRAESIDCACLHISHKSLAFLVEHI
jgi:hypothetical protein